jgi:hypothetical protein
MIRVEPIGGLRNLPSRLRALREDLVPVQTKSACEIHKRYAYLKTLIHYVVDSLQFRIPVPIHPHERWSTLPLILYPMRTDQLERSENHIAVVRKYS